MKWRLEKQFKQNCDFIWRSNTWYKCPLTMHVWMLFQVAVFTHVPRHPCLKATGELLLSSWFEWVRRIYFLIRPDTWTSVWIGLMHIWLGGKAESETHSFKSQKLDFIFSERIQTWLRNGYKVFFEHQLGQPGKKICQNSLNCNERLFFSAEQIIGVYHNI